MKKCILAVMALIFCLTCSLPVFAAGNPGYVIDCTEEFELNASATEGEYTFENGYLHWITADDEEGDGMDPYLAIDIDEPFDAEEYPFAKICIKNLSDVTNFEFHYNPGGTGITGYTKTHFAISAKDTDFKTYIINIPEKNIETIQAMSGVAVDIFADQIDGSTWKDDITQFRLDFFWIKEPGGGCVPGGAEMYVKYIAFFKTAADAEAYDFDAAAQAKPSPSPTATAKPTATNTPAPSKTASPSPSAGTSDDKSGIEDYLIWIIAGGVVVLGGAGAAVIMLKKKKK